jgi:Flp pilus assembly protein TadG
MNRCIRHNSGNRNRRRGSEVLELALLLPILLGLAFGAAAYGYYFFVQHNVQGAAREGARAGIPFNATQADADAKITNYLTNAGLTPADFSISFSHNVETAAPGTDITVTVEGVWSTVGITLLPPPLSPAANKIVRGRAVMRKEG